MPTMVGHVAVRSLGDRWEGSYRPLDRPLTTGPAYPTQTSPHHVGTDSSPHPRPLATRGDRQLAPPQTPPHAWGPTARPTPDPSPRVGTDSSPHPRPLPTRGERQLAPPQTPPHAWGGETCYGCSSSLITGSRDRSSSSLSAKRSRISAPPVSKSPIPSDESSSTSSPAWRDSSRSCSNARCASPACGYSKNSVPGGIS